MLSVSVESNFYITNKFLLIRELPWSRVGRRILDNLNLGPSWQSHKFNPNYLSSLISMRQFKEFCRRFVVCI